MATAPRGPRVDLHTHSRHSDGSHAPAELVPMATAAGLLALALTDHDTLAGLPELHAAAAGSGLAIVDGVELSASSGSNDIHILGYFVDPAHPGLTEALERFQEGRRVRAVRMVERLNQLGAAITMEDVHKQAGAGVLGRPHVAHALLEAGCVQTFDAAFRIYLGHHAPAFVPKPRFKPEEAIALIRAAGGVAVMAHPGTAGRDDLIPLLRDAGLAGLEVWHPKHSASQTAHYLRLADRLGLVPSGGSDFHGAAMGPVHVGMCEVPAHALDDLRARR